MEFFIGGFIYNGNKNIPLCIEIEGISGLIIQQKSRIRALKKSIESLSDVADQVHLIDLTLHPSPARSGVEAVRGPEIGSMIAEDHIHHRPGAWAKFCPPRGTSILTTFMNATHRPRATADVPRSVIGDDNGSGVDAYAQSRIITKTDGD